MLENLQLGGKLVRVAGFDGLAIWTNGTKRLQKLLMRAAKLAGTRALSSMRTQAKRSVRARKAFKASALDKSAFQTTKFKGKGLASMSWTLGFSGKAQPVLAYKNARQTTQGVTVQINRGRQTLIKGAFIAEMKSGHRGVFYRLGKSRLPIDEAFSTRVSDVFKDDEPTNEVIQVGEAVFAQRWQHEFTRLALGQGARKK